jgi:hypothetical protein
MLYNSRVKSVALVGAIGASLLAASPAALAQTFNVANLVSDGSIKAANTDPNLINPWGIAASPTGPLWVSDNNSGFTTVYNGAGSTLLTVSTPAAPGEGGVGATTGQVFNGSSSAFKVSSGGQRGIPVCDRGWNHRGLGAVGELPQRGHRGEQLRRRRGRRLQGPGHRIDRRIGVSLRRQFPVRRDRDVR